MEIGNAAGKRHPKTRQMLMLMFLSEAVTLYNKIVCDVWQTGNRPESILVRLKLEYCSDNKMYQFKNAH